MMSHIMHLFFHYLNVKQDQFLDWFYDIYKQPKTALGLIRAANFAFPCWKI
jgi:hypothetical protein